MAGTSAQRRKVHVVGVPSELGAGTRGASLALDAIRTASLVAQSPYFVQHPLLRIPTENQELFKLVRHPFANRIPSILRVSESMIALRSLSVDFFFPFARGEKKNLFRTVSRSTKKTHNEPGRTGSKEPERQETESEHGFAGSKEHPRAGKVAAAPVASNFRDTCIDGRLSRGDGQRTAVQHRHEPLPVCFVHRRRGSAGMSVVLRLQGDGVRGMARGT